MPKTLSIVVVESGFTEREEEQMMPAQFDDAVVGAGSVGLAHAYTLAKHRRLVAEKVCRRFSNFCGFRL